jgi:hypothetical protein
VRAHRNAQPRVFGKLRDEVPGQAARLAAERQHIARRVRDVVRRARGLCREGEPAARRAAIERCAARGEARMHAYLRVFVIVETRAAQLAIVHPESQRLDEMELGAGIRRQPDHVAGIGRDFGMDKDDGEHLQGSGIRDQGSGIRYQESVIR